MRVCTLKSLTQNMLTFVQLQNKKRHLNSKCAGPNEPNNNINELK